MPKRPNGTWTVQWDTRMAGCSNGRKNLDTWAFRNDGSKLGNTVEWVAINNRRLPPPPPPRPPPSPVEPGPIAKQGYTRVFDDEFDTLNRRVWCSHQWWEPVPPLGTQYVHRGVLHVTSRRVDGYPNNTITSEPCRQANPRSFQLGYFEARMRWTAGNGSSPSFWLFSTRHAKNPSWPHVNGYCARHGLPEAQCYSGELDVFEGQGHEPTVFIGTVHRNSCNCYGVKNEFRQGVPNLKTGVDMTAGFHTYSMRWTPTAIRWYLDGKPLGTAAPYDSTNEPMHLLFYQWPQSWTHDTDRSSPNVLDTEVDWVRVWQAVKACRVPNVVGSKLANAKERIKARTCRLGHVSLKPSTRAKKGRVLGQKPRAGVRKPAGTKVNLAVGRGGR